MQNSFNDPLWRVARQRASFKKSLSTYFVVNTFLVAIWYLTSGRHDGYFWPVWPIIGWGFGLFIQYLGAYHGKDWFSAEKEYEQLKRDQPNS